MGLDCRPRTQIIQGLSPRGRGAEAGGGCGGRAGALERVQRILCPSGRAGPGRVCGPRPVPAGGRPLDEGVRGPRARSREELATSFLGKVASAGQEHGRGDGHLGGSPGTALLRDVRAAGDNVLGEARGPPPRPLGEGPGIGISVREPRGRRCREGADRTLRNGGPQLRSDTAVGAPAAGGFRGSPWVDRGTGGCVLPGKGGCIRLEVFGPKRPHVCCHA